jgi:hypothetical protein
VGYLAGKVETNRPGFFSRFLGRKTESTSTARGVTRLAQAMVGNRDLLVLDDPFEGLNPAETGEAKALIRDMIGRGKTVILSSDSLMEVKDLCQRFVIIHEGKVQATGTLPELLAAGGAIRFLPAVLPRETVERVLNTLREEILGESAPTQATVPQQEVNLSDPRPVAPGKPAAAVPHADTLLTPLTKPSESVPSASPIPPVGQPIDHGKLDQLTKPKPG